MNTAEFCLRNVKHALTNRTALFFHIVFPLFMYVFIGVILLNEDEDAGGFSARAYIAVVMALFGALMAAVSTSATIVTEQTQSELRKNRENGVTGEVQAST